MGLFFYAYILSAMSRLMQFNEREMNRILLACEYYYQYTTGDRKIEYDKLIDKLHSYEEEYECPDCVICSLHM